MESTAITSWKGPACRRAVTASSNATGSKSTGAPRAAASAPAVRETPTRADSRTELAERDSPKPARIREQLADEVAADLRVRPELALDEADRAAQADRKDIDGSRLRNPELAGDEKRTTVAAGKEVRSLLQERLERL